MGKQLSRKKRSTLIFKSNKAIQKEKQQKLTKLLIEDLSASLSNQETEQLPIILKKTLEDRGLTSNHTKTIDIEAIQKWSLERQKICPTCRKREPAHELVYCDPCEDFFHRKCVNLKRKPGPNWICPTCKEQRKMQEDSEKLNKKSNIKVIIKAMECSSCKSELQYSQKTSCRECKNLFHSSCLGEGLICQECSSRIQRRQDVLGLEYPKIDFHDFIGETYQLPDYKSDKKLIKSCKTSLFKALSEQRLDFSDDLLYRDVDSSLNTTIYEPILYTFSDNDLKVFEVFKQMTRKAFFGPFRVIKDQLQGFIVRAEDQITKGTLISEYVGDVRKYRDVVFSSNDSIMTLVKSPQSEKTLVIIPDQHANLAKYISGVNNSDKSLRYIRHNNKRKKQNVASIRVNVDNKIRILLYALRLIKKGEILYYDYNAGGDNLYETSDFI